MIRRADPLPPDPQLQAALARGLAAMHRPKGSRVNLNERAFGIVIVFLGLTLLACVGGFIGLAVTSHPIPDVLQNVAVGALTGLAGLLARTPNQPPPAAGG